MRRSTNRSISRSTSRSKSRSTSRGRSTSRSTSRITRRSMTRSMRSSMRRSTSRSRSTRRSMSRSRSTSRITRRSARRSMGRSRSTSGSTSRSTRRSSSRSTSCRRWFTSWKTSLDWKSQFFKNSNVVAMKISEKYPSKKFGFRLKPKVVVPRSSVKLRCSFKVFAVFTGKQLCWCLFSNKVACWRCATPAQAFPCKFCKIFKNNHFEEHQQTIACYSFLF